MPKFLKEITFSGQSTPATPDPGYGSVYIDGPTNLLYYIDDAGVTYDLTSGATGTDVFVTGGTYSAGTATFTNNTGGTFNVTGFTTGGTSLYWYDENDTPPAIAPIATGAGSIALGNGARALSCNMFVYGNTAGSGATNSCFSNFIGYQAGEQATNACQSNLLGPSAGYQATNASNSNFIGTNAGYQATNACNSNFLGNQAGSQATTAINSNFFGPSAGQCAANANNSNFFGTNSGYYATNASGSTFMGQDAGFQATNACNSNFIGICAGNSASGAYSSNFFGWCAGHTATSANNSNFLGLCAGCSALNAYNSNFLGIQAGSNSTYANNSNFFGFRAGDGATNSCFSNFIGPSAGRGATDAFLSNFFGSQAGQQSTNANASNFFGFSAGFQATNSSYSNFFGSSAGCDATNASGSNFLGERAGVQATSANNSNFIGTLSGYFASASCYSTFIGYQTGKCFAGNNLCRNNIIIGTNITLPNGRKDSLNIGGTIFGEDLYYETVSDPFAGVESSGKIGIGVVSPTNTLHISGTTNPLRIQGLITSANTNYLVANSDGVVTLTSGSSGSDTYVTGFTYNSANTLTIQQNNAQPNLTASINTMTGLTIIGNLSATTIDTTYIDFAPLTARPAHSEARIYWYDDEKTLELQTENSGFNIEVGHQTVVRVRNTTGGPLTKGSLVYINGGSGNNPTVTLASYELDSDSARTLGYLGVNIPDNQYGYVITNGMVRDVNTTAYSAGTQLYLYTGGTYTNVRPIAPLHEVRVGVVIRQSATVGIIFASIMNGYELGELHDVRISGVTNNDLLQYNSSLSAWTNTQSIQITSLTANTISATTYQNLPYGVAGVNNQTVTAYTFSLTDSGYLVTFNSSTYIQATIPTNTSAPYAIGSQIMLSQLGAGQLRVTGDTGVTLYSYGNAYNLVGQYSTAFLTKQATNTWILDGNLTTLNL